LNQISGAGGGGPLHHPPTAEPFQARHHHENQAKFQRAFVDGDFEFVSVILNMDKIYNEKFHACTVHLKLLG
jgi:predicted small lipoprotein YifL